LALRNVALTPLLELSIRVAFVLWNAPMRRTIPSWRIAVEQEIAVMSRFRQFLRPEDRAVFDNLLTQCKLYAARGEVFTSPERKMSILFWMIFAQHKKLAELEKCTTGSLGQ
jgi:hypothetical protein